MSTSPESGPEKVELDLDLQMLPAWAQRPPGENKYAKYEGREEDRAARQVGRSPRGEPRHLRQDFRKGRLEARTGQREPRSWPPKGKPDRGENKERPAPRIEVNAAMVPDEKGVESLARQIHLTGRAYPLFDIAALILQKTDRYRVRFSVVKTHEGKIVQPLLACGLDDTLWLSEQDALDHVLRKHFATFYQAERVATDPPKGTYTFVAQCGMSGTILGPPNYHDYQNKLRRLHSERFSHMPFEAYKARIKIVRDESIVKRWVEEQSWKTEYLCLNVPESPRLGTLDEVEKHFREFHLPNVIKIVEVHTMAGSAAHMLPDRALQGLARRTLEDQARFPLKVVNVLSTQFAGHGLQFFKVNKTVTHVAVARPHYLDLEATPVSEGIKRIVNFINGTAHCTRRKLLQSLAPDTPISGGGAEESPSSATAAPSPEAAALVSDLHWLIHQGHVIEFSNGVLDTAKKPALKPPKIEAKSDSAAVTGEALPSPDQSEISRRVQGDPASLEEAPREVAENSGTATTATTETQRDASESAERNFPSTSNRDAITESTESAESVPTPKPAAEPSS